MEKAGDHVAPMQVHCAEEAADFQKIASALLINVGTLSTEWVAGMKMAAGAANILQKPWVLDPVAAGATPFRTEVRDCNLPVPSAGDHTNFAVSVMAHCTFRDYMYAQDDLSLLAQPFQEASQ